MENQDVRYIEREAESPEKEEYKAHRRGIRITGSLSDHAEPGLFGIWYAHEPVKVSRRDRR
jgi:hypothetical protein